MRAAKRQAPGARLAARACTCRQAGHITTELVPMLAGAAGVGAVIGFIIGVDAVKAAAIAVAVAFVGFLVLSAAYGIYSDFASARGGRRRIEKWLPAGGLARKAAIRFFDGSESEIHGVRGFGGVIDGYNMLGIDVAGGRVALADGDRLKVVERGQIRSWRRSRKLADAHFVIELVTPKPAADHLTPVLRIEVNVPADVGADRLDDAMRRALGEPAGP
jgi:hypothetical protein